MPLDERQAFKAGFIRRCVEDGLSPSEMAGRAKAASALLEKGAVLRALAALPGQIAGMGLPLVVGALTVPPALGYFGGRMLAQATDVDDTDVDSVKNQELVEEYRRQAAYLRNEALARQNRGTRRAGGRGLP